MPDALRIVDELSELDDVVLTSISNGEVLVYDFTSSKWINATVSSAPISINTTAKTDDYTATNEDGVIVCDASSRTITVTLTAAASSEGKDFFIKKIDSSENAVNIDGNGDETIDEADVIIMLTQNECIHVVCDGTTWYII